MGFCRTDLSFPKEEREISVMIGPEYILRLMIVLHAYLGYFALN